MEIYIGILANDIVDYDLRKFLNIVGNQASFRIVTHDHGNGVKTRYGLVDINSEKLGFQLIARFNGKDLKGSKVVVREYLRRNYSNDQRDINWRQVEWHQLERRADDRRGSLMREAVARQPMLAAKF
ncbi:MAG: RNA-binding protein [Sulfuriflexus sp.]|nr:RNA-binding protein [Sulfuriflexus sp.]